MISNKIQHIFFDLDHTLWDFEKNSALAMRQVFEIHQPNVDCDVFLQHYVDINFQYWERYRKDEITQQQLRYGRLKDTFVKVNCAASDAVIEKMSEDYIRLLPTYNYLFDGAVEILDYLQTKYKLHIITNGFHQVQNHKLTNSNINHYFETITNSENAGVKKPHPAIFEYALQIANADKATSIMIGDCIDADVRGALSCGLDAILFCSSEVSYPDVKQINHLSELKRYL
ncbi:MAG TPA: YjjG family noncanonical pyrimidine nucleotidase [Flavobacterium sp.]|jgi:putative hydrolase of the HAD superfamily|nr:YjjG family noncanonical pyrimidine nucleotidase [Flavobacterium sp.]